MSRELALVFIGCGEVTRTHARLLRRLDPSVRLHYASRDAAKAADFNASLGGHGSFGSYAEALAADGIDVAVVATPPSEHLDPTLAALAAGKSVVVEKPAYPTLEDFGRVRDAAAAAGGTVYVAENYFYKPLAERLRAILAQGMVGEPLVLQVNAVKRQPATGWRGDRKLSGGGGLFEGGVHWVNLMANVGLEVEDVSGATAGPTRPDGAKSAEETTVVTFRYRGGAVGVLTFSWEVPSALHGVRLSHLYGREGTVRFESNGLFAIVTGRRSRLYLPGLRDLSGRRAMWSDFLHSMRTGDAPRMTLEKARLDTRWVLDAYDSA